MKTLVLIWILILAAALAYGGDCMCGSGPDCVKYYYAEGHTPAFLSDSAGAVPAIGAAPQTGPYRFSSTHAVQSVKGVPHHHHDIRHHGDRRHHGG